MVWMEIIIMDVLYGKEKKSMEWIVWMYCMEKKKEKEKKKNGNMDILYGKKEKKKKNISPSPSPYFVLHCFY